MTDRDVLEELRATVRSVVERAAVDRQWADPWELQPEDLELWSQCVELGWTGLLVDERHDGAEAGLEVALVVVEELARRTSTVPYLSSAVLGASAISLAASSEQQDRWLPAVAAGELRVAVGLTGPDGRRPVVRADGDRLTGEAGFVLDGASADLLVIADDAGRLFALERAHVSAEVQLNVDRSRHSATIRLDGAPAERLPEDALEALVQRGSLALAADALGAARRALEIAVAYAGAREQFGRPIGSFQAIKHKLADMYVLVQGADAALSGAARAVDGAQPGSDRLVAVASAYARDAASAVTGEAIQVHGGIGYTWEHECHRLWKRAVFDELHLRTPTQFRDELATLVLAPHRAAV